ncbi:cbb3-type cytochrome oxidase assembly protein CcoS [Magnetovibrio sp. PR-2]|uniref:cbb3-type cytochrome oxidase assembly protein CcoS n=1 Tax=Magnetovibrio sp. PR-2 TaxID=3120356 RepID=UPI002FCE07AA
MEVLLYLIPIALFLGLAGLAAFMWSLKSGQFDDMEGNASRILFEEDMPSPAPKPNDHSKDENKD